MKNNITAIHPNQKSSFERATDWLKKKADHFWSKTITLSFDVKDMPIDASVNNIADFVMNRDTAESIELIKLINEEVERRFSDNIEKFEKESKDLKAYLNSKNK